MMMMMWSVFLKWQWCAAWFALLPDLPASQSPHPNILLTAAGHSWLRWKRWRWHEMRSVGLKGEAAFVLREFKHLSCIITFSSLNNKRHWFTSKMIKTVCSYLSSNGWWLYSNKKQWKWRHSCYRKGGMWGLTQRSAEERLDFVFILWFVTLNMKHFQGADLITTMENMKTGNEGGKTWQ